MPGEHVHPPWLQQAELWSSAVLVSFQRVLHWVAKYRCMHGSVAVCAAAAGSCAEFLVHGVDVEGMQLGLTRV